MAEAGSAEGAAAAGAPALPALLLPLEDDEDRDCSVELVLGAPTDAAEKENQEDMPPAKRTRRQAAVGAAEPAADADSNQEPALSALLTASSMLLKMHSQKFR